MTYSRYGCVYSWPLNAWLPFQKRREILRYLTINEWSLKSFNEVVEDCDRCFRALSVKLSTNQYFIGEQPTELDALTFGHLYTILTTELPNMQIANTLKKYPNLISFCKRIDEEFFAK